MTKELTDHFSKTSGPVDTCEQASQSSTEKLGLTMFGEAMLKATKGLSYPQVYNIEHAQMHMW